MREKSTDMNIIMKHSSKLLKFIDANIKNHWKHNIYILQFFFTLKYMCLTQTRDNSVLYKLCDIIQSKTYVLEIYV